MKSYTIQSKPQPNGLWGTPTELTHLSSPPPFHDEEKYKLFSAIIIALAELNPGLTFSVSGLANDGFFVTYNYEGKAFFIPYSHYSLAGNTLTWAPPEPTK